MNINLFLEKANSISPDQVGLIFENRKYTYSQFTLKVNKLTNALLSVGCGKGSRIAILSENIPEMVFLFYASARVGALFCPIDYTESYLEIERMTNIVHPDFLFFDFCNSEMGMELKSLLPSVKHGYLITGHKHDIINFFDYAIGFPSSYYCEDTDDNDPVAIIFTSGTTGLRKAVVFSHMNYILHVQNVAKTFDNGTLISMNFMPCYHIIGLQSLCSTFYSRHTLVIVKTFDPKVILEQIKLHHVNMTLTSPNRLSAIIQSPYFKQADLSSLSSIIYTGDAADVSMVLEAIHNIPSNIKLAKLYGTTETTYDITMLNECDHDLNDPSIDKTKRIIRLGSIGRPIPPIEVIIADEGCVPLPPGEIGEILVHTDRYMIGYISPENGSIKECDNDYWFHTKDFGYKDEDGYIYIIGHKIDSLAKNGNFSPSTLSTDVKIYPCYSNGQLYAPDSSAYTTSIPKTINHKTFISFLTFLRKIHEASTIEEIAKCYLEDIPAYIDGSMFGLHLLPKSYNSTINPDSKAVIKWDFPYFDSVPVYSAKTHIADDSITLFEDSLSNYISLKDFIEKIQPNHLICVPMYDSSKTPIGILSFGRIDPDKPFNQYEQDLIIQVSKHLCVALLHAYRKQDLLNISNLMENIVMLSNTPIVITDESGNVTHMNLSVKKIFNKEKTKSDIFRLINNNVLMLRNNGLQSFSSDYCVPNAVGNKTYSVKTIISETTPSYYISTIVEKLVSLQFDKLQSILTAQEIEVFKLVSKGLTNKQIADILFISANTVKYHLKNLFIKLDATNRAELLNNAIVYCNINED